MANPISVSKTTKKADLNSTLQKLNAITEIASKYSNKRSKYIFDLASVDDPFNRQHLLKKIDPKDREALSKLITSFEESLDRVLNSQFINREITLAHYRKNLEENIQQILKQKSGTASKTGSSPYNLKKIAFEITDSDPISSPDADIENSPVRAKKRKQLSRDAKVFLQTAFEAKRDPNSRERQLIAEKSGLTPMQVRVWFTNKRMRSK